MGHFAYIFLQNWLKSKKVKSRNKKMFIFIYCKQNNDISYIVHCISTFWQRQSFWRQTNPFRLYRQDTTVNISLPKREQTVFNASSLQQNTQISTDFLYWSETVFSLHFNHKWEVIKLYTFTASFLYSTVVIFNCSGHNWMFSGFTETTAAWQSVQEHWDPSPLNNASAPLT